MPTVTDNKIAFPSKTHKGDDPVQSLNESVTQIASILQALSEPLQTYLHDILTVSQPHLAAAPPLDKMLAESPIAPLLQDDSISDIFINGPYEIYIGRNDTMEKTSIQFPDARNLMRLAMAIAGSVGRVIDPNRP